MRLGGPGEAVSAQNAPSTLTDGSAIGSIDSSYVKAHRSAHGGKRGARTEAIGRSRGGQTTKVHALTDTEGKPYVFLLTSGNVPDIKAAPALIEAMPLGAQVIGDKAYDADSLRAQLRDRGTTAVIPSKTCRKVAFPLDDLAYKERNVIERMFCRLKDFRRVATRYDKLARNFLSAIALAAVVTWWAA